jgi:hypothetical protein
MQTVLTANYKIFEVGGNKIHYHLHLNVYSLDDIQEITTYSYRYWLEQNNDLINWIAEVEGLTGRSYELFNDLGDINQNGLWAHPLIVFHYLNDTCPELAIALFENQLEYTLG